MAKTHHLLSALGAILAGPMLAQAQVAPAAPPRPIPAPIAPAPIEPPITDPAAPAPFAPPIPSAAGTTITTTTTAVPGLPANVDMSETAESPNAPRTLEFQGEEVGLVLRTLARAAKMNLLVSDKVIGTVVLRLEDKTPKDAISVIVDHKGLVMDEKNGVYSIKTAEERAKEPTEPGSYTFSYATAEKIVPLLDKQLTSGMPSQYDLRTNTVFFRETKSSMDKVLLFLETVDRPTEQVMIEARLVEVTANPKQSYGINWGGVVGSSSSPQTFRYGGTTTASSKVDTTTGAILPDKLPTVVTNTSGQFSPQELLFDPTNLVRGAATAIGGQFAILSAPQMSVSLRLLNEDSDAEFLANPRIVTANNQKAEIKITRNQPVPQLNFNEQTAQAVFSGFQDKEFGNTLVVTPVINKDNFITLAVKPEISNKVGDAVFTFSGATVTSPVIDKRTLESNVLIKSGDTLAIGGLLQDEVTKGRTKVPVLGDIPGIGYLFQEKVSSRTKRNLLVFVTPTVIKQGYGTGLEDQVTGIKNSGDTYADPNGWRNNAKGAIRLTPTSNRPNAADYPKPGIAPAPKKRAVRTSVTTISAENK